VEGQEQQESASSGPGQPAAKRRGRLLAAYAIVAVVALTAIAAVIVLSYGSDSAARGNPHINLDSGITNGIAPDNRAGIEPPELEELSLQKAAQAAGCELQTAPPRRGPRAHPGQRPRTAIQNAAADLRRPPR
jgi:hypothetical protein